MAMTAAEKQKAYRARQKKAKTGGAEKEAVGLLSEAEQASRPVRVGMSETTSKGNTRRTAVTVPPKDVAKTVKEAPGRDVSVTSVETPEVTKSPVPGSRKFPYVGEADQGGQRTSVDVSQEPSAQAVTRNVTRGPNTQPGDSPTGGRVPTGTRSDKEKAARNLPESRTATRPVGATGIVSERSPSAVEKEVNRASGRKAKAQAGLEEAAQTLPGEMHLLGGMVKSAAAQYGVGSREHRKAWGQAKSAVDRLARSDPGFRAKMSAGLRKSVVPALEKVDKATQAESRRKVRLQREQSGAAMPRVQGGRKVEDSPEGVARRLRGTVYKETPLAEDRTLSNLGDLATIAGAGASAPGHSAARRIEARMGKRLTPAVEHPSGAGEGQLGLFPEAEGKKATPGNTESLKGYQKGLRERQFAQAPEPEQKIPKRGSVPKPGDLPAPPTKMDKLRGSTPAQAQSDVESHPLYSKLHEMGSGQMSLSGKSIFHDTAEALRLNVGDNPSISDIGRAVSARQSERRKQRTMGTLPGQPAGEEVGRMTPSTPTYKGSKGEMGEAAVTQRAAGVEKGARKSSRLSQERKTSLDAARGPALVAASQRGTTPKEHIPEPSSYGGSPPTLSGTPTTKAHIQRMQETEKAKSIERAPYNVGGPPGGPVAAGQREQRDATVGRSKAVASSRPITPGPASVAASQQVPTGPGPGTRHPGHEEHEAALAGALEAAAKRRPGA